MGVPTEDELENLMLDRANANATVNPPLGLPQSAIRLRFLNDALLDVWELSGGAAKRVTSVTAWSVATDDGTGKMTGILTDIGEILRVWATSVSGSSGYNSADRELVKVERGRISFLNSWAGLGVGTATPIGQVGEYDRPKVYAAWRKDAAGVAADANKFEMSVWPATAGTFYPIEYLPQFVPLTGATDVPNVTDIEARDAALLAASRIAPLVARGDLVQSIMADISQRTRLGLQRKQSAMLAATQDR